MNKDLNAISPDMNTMVDFNKHSQILNQKLQAGMMLNHIEQIEKE